MAIESSSVPISIRGRYFYKGDERPCTNDDPLIWDKFFVRGVVYQPSRHDDSRGTINDPLSDDRIQELQQSIPLFIELGVNTLYICSSCVIEADSIDNKKPHAEAMTLLDNAGIYVVVTVATPFCSINRSKPYGSYNIANVTSFLKTASIMAGYPNTLGIVAGDSVINSYPSLQAAPVLKAVIRDIKRYLAWSNKTNGTRLLPVSYSIASVPSITHAPGLLEYLYLGDTKSTIDFCMPKSYSWAGESSMQWSGWDRLVSRFKEFAIPTFLSEYGTNIYKPRQFHETKALYSSAMTKVFSGGCVYQFNEAPNRYGLVVMPHTAEELFFKMDDSTHNQVTETRETDQGKLYIYGDFENYKTALAEPIDYDHNWDTMEHEAAERCNADTAQITWPWGPDFQMPETCIDWANIAELVERSPLETTAQRFENTHIA
ncbi:hypothetical protein E4T38_04687 [Aureobasidium subglaciale]|nr:hypothetical protein E4T38_04687 [Aureobasidium subglaciale]KAI5223098.1 hypothetical protein E4T40_04714 [Aureobasidium subglaciale]KAI5226754.1 hypothetical protein E4T41_04657 [Aureobasidium subglaciale]KAI5262394.1 hypothetical protein E4T46_04543 [Aureobasidium subglaciale]